MHAAKPVFERRRRRGGVIKCIETLSARAEAVVYKRSVGVLRGEKSSTAKNQRGNVKLMMASESGGRKDTRAHRYIYIHTHIHTGEIRRRRQSDPGNRSVVNY